MAIQSYTELYGRHSPPDAQAMPKGRTLQARQGFSFYDSLIVAAALESGCSRLLTEDLQHGQRIDGLTIENPFLASAAGP